MMRLLAFAAALAACHHDAAAPPAPPAAKHLEPGPWQTAPTEAYKGKQDDLYFVDAKTGFYGNGAGKVFRTEDGGATWRTVMDKPGTYVRALGFLDARRGFVGNLGPDAFPGVTDPQLLYRTDDGGATWTPVALPDTDGARGVCAIDILALDTVNAGHRLHREVVHVGGRVGGPAALFRSLDGGTTWSRLTLPPEVAMILDVKFQDPSVGFVYAGTDPDVAKSNGLIARTTDGGATWKVVYRSARPFELMWKGAWVDRRLGFATLQNYTGEASEDPQSGVTATAARYVVRTDDGGATWREIPLVDNPKVQEFGIAFVDARRGWVGALPHGFATTDGGAHWTEAPDMPVATNKLRIVRDGTGAHVWAIGLDVRHVDLTWMSGPGVTPPTRAP